MIRKLLLPIFSAGLLITGSLAVAAESGEADKSVHCLNLANIKESKVLSNKYIQFKLRDGNSYVSVLPRPCPGLSANKPFMYRTSLSQLCDLDIITVLESSGFGLSPGASCGLGVFQPMDEEGIRNLKEGEKES